MKTVFCLFLLMLPLLGEELFEFPANSKERKILMELLRPEIATQANRKPGEIKFEGPVKVKGKWAFFVGKVTDDSSKELALEPYGKADTCALFLETKKGWALVDWSAGYNDVYYVAWGSAYNFKAELLGLPDYLNPE